MAIFKCTSPSNLQYFDPSSGTFIISCGATTRVSREALIPGNSTMRRWRGTLAVPYLLGRCELNEKLQELVIRYGTLFRL